MVRLIVSFVSLMHPDTNPRIRDEASVHTLPKIRTRVSVVKGYRGGHLEATSGILTGRKSKANG